MSSSCTTENRRESQSVTLPRSATLPSPSSDVMIKVFFWMDHQLSTWDPEDAVQIEPNLRSVTPELPPTPILERKSVHWTPEVKDNEGKTLRKLRSSPSTAGHKRKSSLSHPKHYPRVPEPPHGPPPAPRPQRLPTPDLPDLKHEEFCNCCTRGPMSKMEAQLVAARSHMVNTKQIARRQTETVAITQRK